MKIPKYDETEKCWIDHLNQALYNLPPGGRERQWLSKEKKATIALIVAPSVDYLYAMKIISALFWHFGFIFFYMKVRICLDIRSRFLITHFLKLLVTEMKWIT